MSTMAENIMQALINEGWIVTDNFEYATKEMEAEIKTIIDDVLGLEFEEIDITDLELPPEEDITDLEDKPFRTWTMDDHIRFQNRMVCDNISVLTRRKE